MAEQTERQIMVYIRAPSFLQALRFEGKERGQKPEKEYRTISFQLPEELKGKPEIEKTLILDYDFTKDGHSFSAGMSGEITIGDLRPEELALISFFEELGYKVKFV